MIQFVSVLLFAVWVQGCAPLKAPPVTEALPIKRIPGLTLAVSGRSASLADRIRKKDEPTEAAKDTESKDTGAIAMPRKTFRQEFRGSDSLLPFSQAVQIDKMAWRSLIPGDEADASEEARKKDELVDQCAEGRPNLDFIEEVTVGVKHKGEKDSAAAVVATYKQARKGLCGFKLTPTYFDIREYVKDYVFVIHAKGTLPEKPVSISGYFTAQDYEGF